MPEPVWFRNCLKIFRKRQIASQHGAGIPQNHHCECQLGAVASIARQLDDALLVAQ
jgi:hypothetical protein